MVTYKILGPIAILVASVAVSFTPTAQDRLSSILEYFFQHLIYLKKVWLPPLPNDGPELSLLLVGAAGNGRSALANYIVGRIAFDSRLSARIVTRDNKVILTKIGPRKLHVVDTPGLLGNKDMVEVRDVVEKLKSSFTQSPKGYSAFLVVMNQANRITKEQIHAIKILEFVFGDDLFKHAIFLFTHKDVFENSFDASHDMQAEYNAFIDNLPDDMMEFIHRAGNRVMFVNNLEPRPVINRDFQIELIHMIDAMTRGRRYTQEHFNNAQNKLKEEIERKLRIANSGYIFNLNIQFPGSDFVMKAIDYLLGGVQKLLAWEKSPPLLH